MRIVADERIPCVRRAFGRLGQVVTFDGREIDTEAVSRAEALIVRSVTRVDRALLGGSQVRLVGTATSGYDHIERAWLAARGIGFAHAPGANATAVADWVLAALAALAADGRHTFARASVGVIGAGEVGTRVARRLAAVGYQICVCDPPRAAAEGGSGFVSLETALRCDVVTLHVPLTESGPHATRGLLDGPALAALAPGAVLLHAARGGIVDEDALATRLDDGPDLATAVDTWAGEPAIDSDLLTRVALATPHIAGHSLEGRLRATAMVARVAAAQEGVPLDWDWHDELPESPGVACAADAASAVLSAYDPRADDRRLRALLRLPSAERAAAFERIRAACGGRRELGFHRLVGDEPPAVADTGLGGPDPGDRAIA
jgi:erythronate-4-phosphate dehydrogenase